MFCEGEEGSGGGAWIMGSGEVEDQKGGTPFNAGGAAISCSICLEVVTDSGDRSTARLQCGHQFHLGNYARFLSCFA